jgi:hypothetical protein
VIAVPAAVASGAVGGSPLQDAAARASKGTRMAIRDIVVRFVFSMDTSSGEASRRKGVRRGV